MPDVGSDLLLAINIREKKKSQNELNSKFKQLPPFNDNQDQDPIRLIGGWLMIRLVKGNPKNVIILSSEGHLIHFVKNCDLHIIYARK